MDRSGTESSFRKLSMVRKGLQVTSRQGQTIERPVSDGSDIGGSVREGYQKKARGNGKIHGNCAYRMFKGCALAKGSVKFVCADDERTTRRMQVCDRTTKPEVNICIMNNDDDSMIGIGE